MCKPLALALNISEHTLSRTIAELEALAGYPSEDVRLLSELIALSRAKITSLGLDPSDSTAEEIYWSAITKYADTANSLARALALDDVGFAGSNLATVRQVMKNYEQDPVWALKSSVLRKILVQHPPRNLMKSLGYRSAASMLKRENPYKLYAAAQDESQVWRRAVDKQLQKVTVSSMEMSRARLFIFDDPKWAIGSSKQPVSMLAETGSVAVWPSENPGDALAIILDVLERFEQLNDIGMAVRFYRASPGFNRRARRLWKERTPIAARLAGLDVPWRAIRHHYLHRPAQELEFGLLDLYETSPSPANSSDISSKAGGFNPALRWWSTCSALVFTDKDGQHVSLNISDVAHNLTTRHPFASRILSDGRRRLSDELLNRYLAYPGVEKELKQLLHSGTNSSPKRTLKRLSIAYQPYVAKTNKAGI